MNDLIPSILRLMPPDQIGWCSMSALAFENSSLFPNSRHRISSVVLSMFCEITSRNSCSRLMYLDKCVFALGWEP